jgi:hypothetical protein
MCPAPSWSIEDLSNLEFFELNDINVSDAGLATLE